MEIPVEAASSTVRRGLLVSTVRGLSNSVAVLTAGIVAIALSIPAKAQPATFEAGACDLPGVTAALVARLRCGTVAVARDYARPEAGSFGLPWS